MLDEGNACRYIPAEVLNGDLSELPKADMFMLGITLYELAMCMELPTGECTLAHHLHCLLNFVARLLDNKRNI